MIQATTLLTALVEHSRDGMRVTNLSGEPYALAVVNAVVENYHRLTDRLRPSKDDLLAGALRGDKVTLILRGEGMFGAASIRAQEGTLFVGSIGTPAIKPKGARTKGYRINPDSVLDLLDGWCTPSAQGLIDAVRDHYPALENLTMEHLTALPTEGALDPPVCSLAVFGEWRMPDTTSHDAIWLLGEYWPEDDICDRSVLLIRPQHGFSEHGSVYGRQLLGRPLGVVKGFEPISYAEAVNLCDLDFDVASARVLAKVAV